MHYPSSQVPAHARVCAPDTPSALSVDLSILGPAAEPPAGALGRGGAAPPAPGMPPGTPPPAAPPAPEHIRVMIGDTFDSSAFCCSSYSSFYAVGCDPATWWTHRSACVHAALISTPGPYAYASTCRSIFFLSASVILPASFSSRLAFRMLNA